MPKSILLHVGYHKTGTTWIQNVFFQERFGYRPVMDHDQVWKHIADPHPFQFVPEVVKSIVAGNTAGIPEDIVPVLSSEDLSGHPFYGGLGNAEFARRLHSMFPDARILITIREQIKIITSVYMHYITRGGTNPPRTFFVEESLPGFTHFSAEHFCYHHFVRLYRELFGPDRVLVLTQEEMAGDLAGFLAQVAAFSQAEPHEAIPRTAEREGVSYPEFAYPLQRRINHFRWGAAAPEPILDLGPVSQFLYRGAGKLARQPLVKNWLRTYRPVTDFVARRFEGRFTQSNRALRDMLGGRIDLSGYQI